MSAYDDYAHYYDIAFAWDIEDEVDWLVERLGGNCREILEPACGSGRMFPPLARRGVSVFGVDISEVMLERARRRITKLDLPAPDLLSADIRDFDLGRKFDGAICPINTFGHLQTEQDATDHLRCIARHLRPGGRYLVQMDLRNTRSYSPMPVDHTSDW